MLDEQMNKSLALINVGMLFILAISGGDFLKMCTTVAPSLTFLKRL